MPRSSRHRSHRADEHASEEEGGSRDRNQRADGPAAGSGARISKDPDPEKCNMGNNERIGPGSGDLSAGKGKKRKDRVEDSPATDRWVGGGEDCVMVDKRPNGEAFGSAELVKTAKSKVSSGGSKGRPTSRHEGPTERYEESEGKVESGKQRSEKDSSKRESSGQHKDAKERDKEGGSERDKNARESRYERSDDGSSRNHRAAKTGSSGADGAVNNDKEESGIQEELRNPELEKELEKRIRRRDGSSDKDKWQGDCRESDDRRRIQSDDRRRIQSDDRRKRDSDDKRRIESDDKRNRDGDDKRLSSRDDHTKNGSYGNERHKGERNRDSRYSRDKYQDDLDRDRRHRDDRHRDEHSRDRTSDRYDSKYIKDDKPTEAHHKKSKLQNSDHDGSANIDHGPGFKDIRGRKRSSDRNEDHRDLKLRSTKQHHGDVEKNASDKCKLDSHMVDKARSDYRNPSKVDSNLNDKRLKSSPRSSNHGIKDQSRYLKQAESTLKESPSQDGYRSGRASADHTSISIIVVSDYESRSREKTKPMDSINSGELKTEVATAPLYDRTPRSDGHISPINLTEKYPSASDRRYPSRSGARHSLDVEDMEQISSTPMDGRDPCKIYDREQVDNPSQMDMQTNNKHVSRGSSLGRAGHTFGSSPGHLPPRPPVRPRTDSPSVLGSFEVDNRYQTGDRKSNSRYKRIDDYNFGRAQGNAWRSNPATRPPVPNGFVPFQQHGLLPPAFHSALQQFPDPSLYGMRPMDIVNSPRVSYHMHEAADRFSSHGRLFGFHNLMTDSCPQLHGWDGSNGGYGDESHIYGRAEWDENRHLMGSRGWEMSAAGIWKGQNGNMNMEFPVPQTEQKYLKDDAWAAESGHRSHTERARSECVPDERTGIKPSNDTPSAELVVEALQKIVHEKTNEPSKTSSEEAASTCRTYLSEIDISPNLTCLELHKVHTTLMGPRDPPNVSSFSRHRCLQLVNEDTKAATKNSNDILQYIFPKITDNVYQRAVSLYKRHKEATKFIVPVLPAKSEEGKRDHPETSDVDEVKADDHQASEEMPKSDGGKREHLETSDMEQMKADDHQASEDTPKANNACSDAMDIEVVDNTFAGEHKSDHQISDAVVSVESPRECAMMPESITANISRILDCPESTH